MAEVGDWIWTKVSGGKLGLITDRIIDNIVWVKHLDNLNSSVDTTTLKKDEIGKLLYG